jgi:hypothetical protein
MRSALRRSNAWHSGGWFIVAALLNSCGGGGGATEPRDPAEVILEPAALSLTAVGQTQQLSATVVDSQGDPLPDPGLSWSTSDPAVATVSSTGLVTAEGSGSAEITAEAGSVTGQAQVDVTQAIGFQIEVKFIGSATASQRAAVEEAQARWETIITSDLEDVHLSASAGECGTNSPAVDRPVDDVLIVVTVDSIDGDEGVLASAGPCFVRVPGDLPVFGAMRLDEADLDGLQASGLLSTVILHEMAHVLGFGLLWDGLLVDPSLPPDTTQPPNADADPHFIGARALVAFDAIGGAPYTGAKVPLEDTGGQGTADSHWRESIFGNELMTGFVSGGQNPLSAVTVASLADLGYVVDEQAADDFALSLAAAAVRTAPRIHLGDDLLRVPIRAVTSSGRMVGLLRR